MKIEKWYCKDNFIEIECKNKKVIIRNNSDVEGKVYSTSIFRVNDKYVNVDFSSKTLSGSGAIMSFINRKRMRVFDVILGSKTSSKYPIKGFLMPIIIVKPMSEIEISDVNIVLSDVREYTFNKFLGEKKMLLITPLYPSPDNLYACGFVHSRVKSYIEAGLDVEVAVINSYNISSYYEFDGVQVYKTDYSDMRDILMAKSYDGILLHFLDSTYAKYLTSSYLNDTPIFLWNHGADILFKDYEQFYTPYFSNEYVLPEILKKEYDEREKYIIDLASNKNVNWIFVSDWEKNRAEKLLNIKFNNSVVIHNFIDNEIFKYVEKNGDERKNIFMVRRFDNTKKYAIDIAVLTILELSRREIFKDLNFYLCGEGNYFNELVEPIRKFKNVIINNNFLTHEQIYEYHKKCGIALFPTRQDTQGVSALEAASSGLVVVSSDIPVINEFFDKKLGTLCETENYIEYADTIEKFYNDSNEFKRVSKLMSENTFSKCSFEKTIEKEINYINKNKLSIEKLVSIPKFIDKDPLLTITIPSYNASKFLQKCLLSLLKSKYLGKLEILIINDGSKDNTKDIGLYFENLLNNDVRKIVRLIDKENGGHGSGINKGIELANGKYFRVIDSDDWVDTDQLDSYIEKLQYETADEVLTDYCEARTFEDKPVPKETFKFMNEDVIYNVNDICSGVYGFRVWGPSLPTATYKLDLLRKTNFKLPEHMFYVDMLYNAYSIININTIKKYSENIYRYFIGNVGQSVSQAGMMKNHMHHENVILKLMDIISNDSRVTPEKKEYMLHMLLLPMVVVQYHIYLDLFHSKKKFMSFEKRISKYSELIKYPEFNERRIKFYRRTFGIFVPLHPYIHGFCEKFRKVFK